MLGVYNLVYPSPDQFDIVIRGMRNAFKSYDKADSRYCEASEGRDCANCSYGYFKDKNGEYDCFADDPWINQGFVFGPNDLKLAKTLISAGDPSHRKFLRQLPVSMDIEAPLYWWKQMDTYSVGTTTNSESTMHCMVKKPFELEDFSLDHASKDEPSGLGTYENVFVSFNLKQLNELRDKYLETKDIDYWYLINEFLPQSYYQKRTWTANYEVILNIINQRKDHKLAEWQTLIKIWFINLPFLRDFALAAGIIKEGDFTD